MKRTKRERERWRNRNLARAKGVNVGGRGYVLAMKRIKNVMNGRRNRGRGTRVAARSNIKFLGIEFPANGGDDHTYPRTPWLREIQR